MVTERETSLGFPFRFSERAADALFAMPQTVAFLHLMVSLSAHAYVSNGFTQSLRSLIAFRRGRKGERLVLAGRVQQLVWFLHRGTAREVSLGEDGLERTSWFWHASDFLFSYPGFFSREAALSDIELVEDSLLLEISFEHFLWLKESFPEVELLVEKIRAQHEKQRVAYARDLLDLRASERYRKLFAAHRELFNVARHRDIASFLGIRDDSLRRYQ